MNQYQQIILSCLRDTLTDEARAKLISLTQEEWHAALQAADILGVTPLVATSIQRHGIMVPPRINESLQTSLKNNTARNLRLLAEFQKVAKTLQERNIPFIPLKGVYVSSNLYQNIGERIITDIDLLIPPVNLREAVDAIETNTGYHPSRLYDLETEQRNLHHLPPYIKSGAPPLEIHWTLLHPRFKTQLNLQGVWEDSVPAKLRDIQARTLSPNDLLIYLCAHVAYHHVYINSLRSLFDIKLVLDHFSDQFDWETIRERACNWNLTNSLYLTLRLADDLLDCVIPKPVWQSLRLADFNESLLDAARARIFEHHDVPPTLTAIWTRQTFPQRLIGLWKRIAIPTAELRMLYRLPPNSKLVYLYYFARVKYLFVIYGHKVMDLLLGNKQQTEFALRDSKLVHYLNWWEDGN